MSFSIEDRRIELVAGHKAFLLDRQIDRCWNGIVGQHWQCRWRTTRSTRPDDVSFQIATQTCSRRSLIFETRLRDCVSALVTNRSSTRSNRCHPGTNRVIMMRRFLIGRCIHLRMNLSDILQQLTVQWILPIKIFADRMQVPLNTRRSNSATIVDSPNPHRIIRVPVTTGRCTSIDDSHMNRAIEIANGSNVIRINRLS